jgi:hypothetical protein
MADDTAAALVIQLSADFKNFQKEMRAATNVFDQEARKIEQRQKQLRANLEKSFDGIGKYIVGGAALAGIGEFVKKVVETSVKISDVSKAIGIGTNELQAWGLMAAKNGVDQEAFNGGLENFSKSLGAAAVKGGPALKLFQALGVNVKGDTTEAFYKFADAVEKTKKGQQQTALVTDVFGKKMALLTPIIAQGSKALRQQTAEMVKSGLVIEQGANAKIKELDDSWKSLTQQILAIGGNALADPLQKLTDLLKDPEVQSGLKTFAKLLGEIAAATLQAAQYAPALAGAYTGFKIGKFAGPWGGAAGAFIGAIAGGSVGGLNTQSEKQIQAQISERERRPDKNRPGVQAEIKALRARLATVRAPGAAAGAAAAASSGGTDRGDLLGVEAQKLFAGKKELQNLEIAGQKAVRDATLAANQEIRADNLATDTARRSSVREQDNALLLLAQGTADYYKLEKEVITETASLDIGEINERKDAELKAIAERAAAQLLAWSDERRQRKTLLDELVLQDKITRGQANTALKQFDSEVAAQRAEHDAANASKRVALETETALQIKGVNIKKNADLTLADEAQNQVKVRAIALNDTLRSGVEAIGVSAIHGFKSMESALSSFLSTLADTIIQLYVMKPILDSLFGPANTFGGGAIGKLIPGFAGGTNSAPGGAAIVGENGPELVNLPRGSQVIPNIPGLGSRGYNAITIKSDLAIQVSGNGDAELHRQLMAGANALIQQNNRQVIPSLVAHLNNNPRLR